MMGLPLADEAVQALEARTEGWIAGLQLAALSMRGVDDLAGFVRAFSGSHRHLVDYLTEEVLVRQSPPVQQFLLQTSVLDRFCASLCDAVVEMGEWPEADQMLPSSQPAQALLEKLERSNLFLVPLDEERRWYRYHHLFSDLLRLRTRQALGIDRLRQIHRRAAAWFEAAELWTEAIQQATAGEAYDIAGRVVAHRAMHALAQGEIASLAEWLSALPPAQVNAHPRLKLAEAWTSLFMGKAGAAAAQLEQALDLIQKNQARDEALLGEALAIRATLAMVSNDMQQNIADSEQALSLLPADYLPLRSLVAWHLAFAFRSTGQAERCVHAYRQAIALSAQGGNVLINLSARREVAEVLMGQGELHAAGAMLAQLVEEAAAGGWSHLYPVSAAQVQLGELHYERNLLDEAAASVQTGITLPGEDFMDFVAYGYALLAHIYDAREEPAPAREAIGRAEQRVLQANNPQRRSLTLAAISRFWLKQGEVARAAAWLPDGRDVPQDPRHQVYCRQQICHARYALATGDTARARQIVDELPAPAQAARRLRDVVELWLLGARLDGVEAVRQALRLAEPAGLVRTFVDEGAVVHSLLVQLQSQAGVPAAYLQRLLSAFGPAKPSPANQLLLEPLSLRELEVLRLMAEGYSNREIAEKLVFTVATAKKHAEHIYGKLGVSSRTQAVARARQLDLL